MPVGIERTRSRATILSSTDRCEAAVTPFMREVSVTDAKDMKSKYTGTAEDEVLLNTEATKTKKHGSWLSEGWSATVQVGSMSGEGSGSCLRTARLRQPR